MMSGRTPTDRRGTTTHLAVRGDYARGGGSSGAMLRAGAAPVRSTVSCDVRRTSSGPDTASAIIGPTPHAPIVVQEKPLSVQCVARGASLQPACSSGAARTDKPGAVCATPSPLCARPEHAKPLPTSMKWPSRTARARRAARLSNTVFLTTRLAAIAWFVVTIRSHHTGERRVHPSFSSRNTRHLMAGRAVRRMDRNVTSNK